MGVQKIDISKPNLTNHGIGLILLIKKNIMINCLFCEKQRIDGYIHYPNLLRTV